MAKYLAMSFADRKRGQSAASNQELLADFNDFDQFRRLESRSTMFPASFAACVPVFMATPTSACASAGASLVPSPVNGHQLPLCLLPLDERHLVFGLASARKSSTPAWRAIAAAVRGLSPVIIMVRMPHGAKMVETLLHAALDDICSAIAPSTRPFSATSSGVPPAFEISRTRTCSSTGMA